MGCFLLLQLQRHGDVLLNGILLHQIKFLKDKPHIRIAVGIIVRLLEIRRAFPIDDDFPCIRLIQSSDDI